jgi:hypothetical protein
MNADQLGKLLQRLARNTRSELSRAETEVAGIRAEQLSLSQRINGHYQQMAHLLLQESPQLGEFQAIQRSLDTLRQEIAQATQGLSQQEEEFQRLHAQHLTLTERAAELESQSDSQLRDNEAAVQARRDMLHFQGELERANALHQELLMEVSGKRQEYERQRIFMFLVKKGYGRPEYRPWRLARNLDGWLAGLVRFKDNHANYQMLEALQKASAARLASLQQQSDTRTSLFQNFVSQSEEALQLPEVYQQINAVEARLSSSQGLIDKLTQKIQRYARGEGEEFSRIQLRLSEQMSKLPLDKLNALVNKTATQQDDLLLGELRTLLGEEGKITILALQKQDAMQACTARVVAADELETSYIRDGYNNPRREYSWGWFERPESFFESYISGEISLQEVQMKLTSIARLLPLASASPSRSSRSWGSSSSRSSWGSRSPSSSGNRSSSSSSSSGGGFSTSSSSGGGGFRTTDSF